MSYRRLFDDLALLIPGGEPVVFDVGANVGQTIEAINQVFDKPQIIAFEPSSAVFEALQNKHFGENVALR